MKFKHVTIPVFVPELACPHKCIFCDQEKISGHKMPQLNEVKEIIDLYFTSINREKTHVEIGFFGGNFTGIPQSDQEAYLDIANYFANRGMIDGIRLSTRPDYINTNVLELLLQKGVTTIELGAQSMDEEVLKQSGRGHTVKDVEHAANLINDFGFDLGLQMMLGLPGDTKEKSIFTAERIVKLGASNTRIYPTLVIKNTPLARAWKKGSYKPLSLEEAIDWTKSLVPIFEEANLRIIRMGLHPSEGLANGNELLDGPFHPSFRELVMSQIWKDIFSDLTVNSITQIKEIQVAPSQVNAAIGHKAVNKKLLQEKYGEVKFFANNQLKGREYYVVPA